MSSAAEPADSTVDTLATQFILDDFHRVQNPCLMTEDYFELVNAKYDDFVAETPRP
jgi:hypothetical protein